VEFRAVVEVRLGQVLSRGTSVPLPRAQQALLALVALWALASLYRSPVPDLAPLQNLPTIAVVAGLAFALRRWPMPTSAVACLAGFLALHTLGGRYAYSYVPYDDWTAALGLPRPADLFGFTRNHYDRLVHFSFGLLLVHPLAAALARHGRVSPRLALYVAVEFVVAASALYEIFEWALTMILAGSDVETYNGQQGDVWDAQKDMAMAGLGALVALVAAALLHARRLRRP
jgi:putative membrane protein